MRRLTRAELLKIRTTRMGWGIAGGVVAGVILQTASSVVRVDHDGRLATRMGVRDVLGSAGWGVVLVLVLGIVAMAGEFRHNTVTPTFLVTPQRGRLVAAKLIATAAVGLGFGALACLTTLVVAIPWLVAKGVDGSLIRDEVGLIVVGVLLATALYGAVGVAVGALIRNQTVAVVASLVWVLIVENLLLGLAPSVGKWLSTGAASALMRSIPQNGMLLSMWAGGLLLAAYVGVIAAAGIRLTVTRDVS